MRHSMLLLLTVITASACAGGGDLDPGGGDGGTSDAGATSNPLPSSLKAEAEAVLEAALAGGEAASAALHVLGLLPVYTCGEPRRTFVGEAAAGLEAEHACVSALAEPDGADGDRITVTFAPGCEAGGVTVEGTAVFAYSGGVDRLALSADLSGLVVDGTDLDAAAGYEACSDQTTYWVAATGTVSGVTFAVDGQVASRAGPPVIGGTTLILDGTGSLTHGGGTDTLTFQELEYEVGDRLPKSGTLIVNTASGHTVRATFTPTLWSLGQVEVVVDDYDPVTIPVLR